MDCFGVHASRNDGLKPWLSCLNWNRQSAPCESDDCKLDGAPTAVSSLSAFFTGTRPAKLALRGWGERLTRRVRLAVSPLTGSLRLRPLPASVLTLTIVSFIPGPAHQEPGILSPSPLDSGFAPSGAPRNDESTKCQKHNTSGASEETAFARLWPLSCRSRCDKGHRVDRSSTRLQLDHFSEDAVAFGQFDQESPNLRSIRNF